MRGVADSCNGRELGAVRVHDLAVLPDISVPCELPPLAGLGALMPLVQEKLVCPSGTAYRVRACVCVSECVSE